MSVGVHDDHFAALPALRVGRPDHVERFSWRSRTHGSDQECPSTSRRCSGRASHRVRETQQALRSRSRPPLAASFRSCDRGNTVDPSLSTRRRNRPLRHRIDKGFLDGLTHSTESTVLGRDACQHFLAVVKLQRVSVAGLADDEDRARTVRVCAVVFRENGVRLGPNLTAIVRLGICEQQNPRVEPHGPGNHLSTSPFTPC